MFTLKKTNKHKILVLTGTLRDWRDCTACRMLARHMADRGAFPVPHQDPGPIRGDPRCRAKSDHWAWPQVKINSFHTTPVPRHRACVSHPARPSPTQMCFHKHVSSHSARKRGEARVTGSLLEVGHAKADRPRDTRGQCLACCFPPMILGETWRGLGWRPRVQNNIGHVLPSRC